MTDKPYWLALTRVSVFGARRIMRLIQHSGSAKKAFTLSEDEVIAAGLPPKVAALFLLERDRIDPDKEWQQCRDRGIDTVTLEEKTYPLLLKEIFDPPPVLYYRGDLQALDQITIAVVGSRKATAYGKAAAEKLSCGLAEAGISVLSGMARGIDSAAHLGALQGKGKTFAVLGCGIDICYPPENKKLRESIVSHGAVISEFPLGTQPKPAHFPIRNRIISGLSRAVVVVEAAEKSGALITADYALEQGRDVFAVPGSIHSSVSKGCHKLIKEGAAVIENVEDIFLSLGIAFTTVKASHPEISAVYTEILNVMEYEPVHFDQIVVASGLSAAALSAGLVELELGGKIRKMTGNYFLRVY